MSNFKLDRIRFRWKSEWDISTQYIKDDIVYYNGKAYVCIVGHNSDSSNFYNDLNADSPKWQLMLDGNMWLGEWVTDTFYSIDNIVKFKGYIYQCIIPHTSNSVLTIGPEGDISNWKIVATTYKWTGEWNENTFYNLYDVVNYQGTVYYCTDPHRSSTFTDGLESNAEQWEMLSRSDNWTSHWNLSYRYTLDDVVTYGGIVYRCTKDHVSASSFIDGLEIHQDNWEIVLSGIEYKGQWQPTNTDSQSSAIKYKLNDIVKYGPSLWICVTPHVSQELFRNTESNWAIWLPGLGYESAWDAEVEYRSGDIVLYGGYAYTALDNNKGSIPSINGKTQDTGDWELLVEGYNHRDEWNDSVEYRTGDVVRNSGYLYIAISDNISSQPDTEVDWKVLVPGTQWKSEWNDDVLYNKGDVVTYTGSSFYCVQRHRSTESDGRPDLDILQPDQNYWIEFVPGSDKNVLATIGDIRTFEDQAARLAIGNNGNALKVTSSPSLVSWESFDEVTRVFYVSPNGVDKPGNGRTLSSPWRTINYACQYILDNEDTDRFNTTIFVKTGLYEESLPIRVPKNCAVVGDELRSTTITPRSGFEQSNMFLVRNGSGIRNMTLQGLFGELGDLNEYQTRRPTAGAYVSLDPGNGPDDESVWIKTKSCYVQNVTTFGTGCIGMKIDGALHNGGNRSIVANDFTQVLSDGIGYWADSLGRSELVSVFTYFCYIGYLASNGGILRATNGNNSYGSYGSRAEGVNLDEDPIKAKINNRDNEAQTSVVYTNGRNIVGVGFAHAGQEYSEAAIEFNGTGTGASANFEEFRENAISQIRLIDPADSSAAGGLNYQTLLNNAQGGDNTSIVLSAADTTGTAERYIGLRVFIEAGKGVGQYGVITGYNEANKTALISKESDFSAGWEHITPGYPIESVLDATTRYRIESRLIIDEPTLEAEPIEAPSENWRYIVYGENKFVAITDGSPGNSVYSSYSIDNGSTWSELSNLGNDYVMSGIVYTGDRFFAARKSELSNGTNTALQSLDGVNWSTITLPLTAVYQSVTSDRDGNVALLSDARSVLYSENNGQNFSVSTITNGTQNFSLIQYGNGTLIAVETGINGNGDVAYSVDNGGTWTLVSSAITPDDWQDIAYGNGLFVIISTSNRTAYSLDGITWYESSIEDDNVYNNINYGQGIFISISDITIAKSKDGRTWKLINDDSTAYSLTQAGNWTDSAYGSDSWLITQNSSQWNRVYTGAPAFGRAIIRSSRVDEFQMYDPGSGYRTVPTVELFDPLNTIDALYEIRINNGVLPQPVLSNRGDRFTTATSLVSGNGFADIYQQGNSISVQSLERIPGPGDNLSINGIDDIFYRITEVTNIAETSSTFSADIKISPSIGNQESPDHNEDIIIRQQYSQVRLTGHDFLDIGTGNINSTRYPELYVEGQTSENETQPQDETSEVAGGRIFYTSTDQDGNFRVGDLFQVEQATGVVSINAEFFELDGLTELSLGGIVVGGSAVVVREFSKEPSFVANSNNIVPTQKAIASYLQSRVSSGGSDAVTNSLIAGQVQVFGNTITTTSNNQINVPVNVNHLENVDGDYAAMLYYGFGSKTN